MTTPLWTPTPQRAAASTLAQFQRWLGERHSIEAGYDALWQWSVDHPAAFWDALWDFCAVIGERAGPALVEAEHMMHARFFPGARLNYAENLLCGPRGPGPALVLHRECGARSELGWSELEALVSRLQQALRALGVGPGDRVAGFVPNIPESVAAMLATASLGAVWSSCSPDFGAQGVADRFGQIGPKVLFTADAYNYSGKTFDSLATAGELARLIPSIEQVVVLPLVDGAAEAGAADANAVSLAEFCAPYAARELAFTRVGFNDPLFILFSSGTTGLPKCIVHGVGGSLLQNLKEHRLQSDLRPGDRLFYFTTCGWMMWNWLVAGLASGATAVLYEGSPTYPDAGHLARIVESERITHFGTSAKFLDACAKAGVRPVDDCDFAALRCVLSTGSPLSAEGFRYVYDAWKRDVCLASIAGGTDIFGCFVGGSPISPVYAGQCQKRQLGMHVQVFDDDGAAVTNTPGELVCVAPFPSQPTGFWNDPDGQRYREAYFERFPGVWTHGDWVELTAEGGMRFFGRSDATLNPGGVRIGTAEIYRQVERIEEVLEGLVIGQQWDNDVRIVLFVRLREGVVLDDALAQRIRSEIRNNATPRHVPAKIVAVADVPRTRSGKITELAVRDVVHGRPVKNVEALANPEALALYRDLPALNA
ncbi:acetoacetate--CoA ligase [Mangrovimicrobium sediminis]|uniref:Acetoacetate--CoA ligase n=1 Tax=Mangrovimicrobium sediminis TaxID=2562682 RepID=A0A4Z0LVJ4_9GAMM|nr:acetoacetate--CoA ligase [Haliea sp. SAOS-164]TGD71075.1 acetoacetate--CoA ligase [Haliea sp. SAOS-164]